MPNKKENLYKEHEDFILKSSNSGQSSRVIAKTLALIDSRVNVENFARLIRKKIKKEKDSQTLVF